MKTIDDVHRLPDGTYMPRDVEEWQAFCDAFREHPSLVVDTWFALEPWDADKWPIKEPK